MFLEAQFGAENLTPIATPKNIPPPQAPTAIKDSSTIPDSEQSSSESATEGEEGEENAAEKKEIERLHKMGIPVPGVEIKVDKMVAKVWLEDLEVECANRIFGDRVRAVVERGVEVTAPLWG